MSLRSWLRQRSRGYRRLAFLAAICSVVLAFVPLFNLIGYESAAFFGVLLGLTTPYLRCDDLSAEGWARQLAQNLALAVPAFLVLSINAAFVKNCAYLVGVEFWVLIVAGAVLVATTLGWLVRNAVADRRRGNIWITLAILASVADFGLRLALQPPIIGYHVFLGYFSGSIYDEALSVPSALVWYRATHLVVVAAVVYAVSARRNASRSFAAIAVVLSVIGSGMFVSRHQMGVDIGRTQIEEVLGGLAESEHFLIYHPRSMTPDQVARMVEDHEFRYVEMAEYFGTDPVELRGEKVKSFVYANRDQKGALMGGRRTLVAKIWLREIHILWRYYGDHMLAHELAHVFTEPFASGPLRLSTRFLVFPNMGIVEGAATAADWDADNLDPHTASAALRRLGGAPDITSLVGASGFWTQSSGRAYTLMGSFIRWLVDEHGMEKFREAYGSGDFERVYQTPARELVADWEKYVDALELSEQDVELARYYYDRQSIFQKVCARTIADLRLEVGERAAQRDVAAARRLLDEIVGFDPTNVNYRVERAQVLLELGEVADAQDELEALLETELDLAQRARVASLLADAHWIGGELATARKGYEECLGQAVPLDDLRLLLVKRRALALGGSAPGHAFDYLLERDHAADVRIYFPARWVAESPGQPLASYLLGRRLWSAGEWHASLPYLHDSVALQDGALRDEAHRMLVQSLHFSGATAEAVEVVAAWQPTLPPYEAAREEWIRRLDWHRARNTVDGGRR